MAASPTPRVAMLLDPGSRRSLCRSPRFRTPVTTGDHGRFLPVFRTGYGGATPRWEGSIPSPRRTVAVASEPAICRETSLLPWRAGPHRALVSESERAGTCATQGRRGRARDAPCRQQRGTSCHDHCGPGGAPPRTAGSRLMQQSGRCQQIGADRTGGSGFRAQLGGLGQRSVSASPSWIFSAPCRA